MALLRDLIDVAKGSLKHKLYIARKEKVSDLEVERCHRYQSHDEKYLSIRSYLE